MRNWPQICNLQVTYWVFSQCNIWIQPHLVKLLVGFQIIIIILVFINVSRIHGKTNNDKMLLKHDNSNKNKYSFDFYYNFLYSGKSQDFLFFLNSCYSDLGSGNSSFIFLTFGLLLIPLAHFLSWYFFNFTFKIFYYILNVYVLIYNFSELFCIWIFFFLHEHILLFIMEIKPSSVPCTAPVSSAFPVCVCACVYVCVCVCACMCLAFVFA